MAPDLVSVRLQTGPLSLLNAHLSLTPSQLVGSVTLLQALSSEMKEKALK